MALSDKNIVIVPNTGSSTSDPTMTFTGADGSTHPDILVRVYPINGGTVSFEGSAGQLFSITNDLGTLNTTLYSVNDVSGMPSLEVLADGTVRIAQFSGNVGIGTATPSTRLHVVANANAGAVTIRNASASGWSSFDLRSSADAQVGGFGYGNASAASFADVMYLYSNAKAIQISTNNGTTTHAQFDTTGKLNVYRDFIQLNTNGVNLLAYASGSMVTFKRSTIAHSAIWWDGTYFKFGPVSNETDYTTAGTAGVTITPAGVLNATSQLLENNSRVWTAATLTPSNYSPLASPTFTGVPAAPTAALDVNTTQIATTAYVINQRGTSNPVMNGTASPGTAGNYRYSREDHVHPVDTSRAALAGATFTGDVLFGPGGIGKLTTTGDIYAVRSGGATGVIYLNTAGTRYLYFDGTQYSMPASELLVSGTKVQRVGVAVNVADGGTGATTLTGYLKGSGTSAITASAQIPAADINGTVGSATSAGTATTATTATNATNVAITNDTTTDAVHYPTFVTATTGNLPQETSSTKFKFNPGLGVLSTSAFWVNYDSTNPFGIDTVANKMRMYAGNPATAAYQVQLGGMTSGTFTPYVSLGDGTNAASRGFLGVGTETPAARLHVSGATGTTALIEATSDGSYLNFRVGGGDRLKIGNAGGVSYIDHNYANSLGFKVSGTEKARLDANGFHVTSGGMGIGTTTPAGRLDVKASSTSYLNGFNLVDSASVAKTSMLHTSGSFFLGTATAASGADATGDFEQRLRIYEPTATASDPVVQLGDPDLTITHAGNVGIGLVGPTEKFHVSGAIKATQSITIGTGGTYAAGSIYSDVSWGMIFRAYQASPASAHYRWAKSDDTQLMIIDTAGTLANAGVIQSTSGGFKFPDATTQTSAAYTKAEADAIATGLDFKASVRVATTANITLSGTQTIDDVAVVAGNRVLVKNQTTGSENGIYVCAAGAWSRAPDADSNTEVTSGMYAFVEEGTTNADSSWVVTTNNPITVGTTALVFAQFSGAGQITAGTGLTKTGNTLSVTANTYQAYGTYVTSVGVGGLPLSVAGTTSPVISIAQATGSVAGYLSSTDWTTFNSKQAAFGSQTANYVYAAPNGSAGAPTFRALVWADMTGEPTTLLGFGIAATDVTAQLLTNYAVGTNAALAATDSILGAFNKIQAQINGKQASGTYLTSANATFVGTTSVSLGRTSANLALTGISSVAFPGGTSGTATVQATATAGTPTLSLPITTGTLVGTGDTGSVSTTMLAASAVTYAKMQNVSATSRVLGRITAAAGPVEELTGANLQTIIGTAATGASGILSSTDWNTFNGKSNTTGTVTSVATDGTALTGGPITTTGTITHSTAAGYKHLPSGGASGDHLVWASAGTGSWAAQPAAYTLPAATAVALGGVKGFTNLTIGGDGALSITAANITAALSTTTALAGTTGTFSGQVTSNGTNVVVTGDTRLTDARNPIITYNNDSASSYQMLWGSGNAAYGTAGITCNPSTDVITSGGLTTGAINMGGALTSTNAGQLDIDSKAGSATPVRINRTGGTGGFIVYAGSTTTANLTLTDAGALTIRSTIGASNFSGSSSGTNTGDNATNSLYSGLVSNATHTGEVTGSVALTIANDAVTYAKMQNVSTNNRVLGRITAGAGDVEELTAANLITIMGITNAGANVTSVNTYTGAVTLTHLGLQNFTAGATVSGSHTGTSSGTNTGDQTNVSGSSGSCTGTAASANLLLNGNNCQGLIKSNGASSPNLHLDPTTGANSVYLCYYQGTGGTYFGNGASGTPANVNSSGTFTGADFVISSDARLKENVVTIPHALATVLALHGVNYNLIASDNKKLEMGLIAQEVREVCPELVQEDKEGMLSIAYSRLAGAFVEAFKDQQKQIEELKALILKLGN